MGEQKTTEQGRGAGYGCSQARAETHMGRRESWTKNLFQVEAAVRGTILTEKRVGRGGNAIYTMEEGTAPKWLTSTLFPPRQDGSWEGGRR